MKADEILSGYFTFTAIYPVTAYLFNKIFKASLTI